MLTIRIDNESEELRAFLKKHKVRYTRSLRQAILEDLRRQAAEFNYKQKKIRNAPSWLYD